MFSRKPYDRSLDSAAKSLLPYGSSLHFFNITIKGIQGNFLIHLWMFSVIGAKMKTLLFLILTFFLPLTKAALATQAHGDPEGIYAHQLAHFFFMLSMVILIYWLRQRKLVRQTGWKYIQYAAFFFIVWNANVMLVHFFDEQAMLITVENISTWQIRVSSYIGKWAEITYYVAKMDHLICVPALLFLFLGLKKIVTETKKSPEDKIG
jgi:hypothetical protein